MPALLTPGQTCWRTARADRFAAIIDAADYFRHVKAAMLRARHRIMLVGWDFDSRVTFERGDKTLPGPNQLGAFLFWMVRKRPALQIHLLKSNLRLLPALDGLWFGLTPVSLLNQISSRRMHFAIDGAHPVGSVHHQKIVVVDDAVAFCGGIDLTLDRWDTRAHEHTSRRRRTAGRGYGPRHDVGVAVDGAAARALGEQARTRWQTATKQSLSPVTAKHSAWPSKLRPTLRNVDVGIALTLPDLDDRPEVRQVEALNLAAIAAARDTIYVENQYLASRTIAQALAQRLREEHGPQIVIVLARKGNNPLERGTMDTARHRLIRLLWDADEHHRLGVYWPVTDGGAPIYIHSKVLAVDDRLLRIGSSNFNNRSMGFDSECDVAIEARGSQHDDVRREITSVRDELVAEHLGVPVATLQEAIADRGSLLAAVEELRGDGKTLRPFTERTVANEAGPLAENELMDPDHVPRSLTRSVQRLITGRRG
ncbi:MULTISPECIES: phospholipase D-like domain-containing protein [Mycobacterium avium complex (MAC)]|uniref:Phospholipase D/transphosphatidylase n=1 Tax=Mycobacterium avium subsp. hominissuis TaxID=439334 RepID=A0AAI8X473_MYCAV|nr:MULTISPECIES: phospholipase D-like domain-containing protein [Mycobacterium avium complex (MAC)]APT12299.1 phospholipase [Mycobacterium avium subsp. hominissuis]ETZ44464.1 phospholipase D family protein [Mycobacterium avium MAV_120709_2344]ETZ47438.1 phospholipase D family protein [Mycobacterium avium MAV_120809_2495]ETZ67727.1 phospholipase D family protein [Mycobacterium sp. MAC_080597_8934]ETZ91391.1 phospholipase D family protein [Mycobacterium sp. MAC_011194_8550]